MNNCTFTGRLGNTPELKQTPTGKSVCSFRLAVDRPKNQNGETNVDWFNMTAWDKKAEFINRFLTKGRKVLVSATAQTRSYLDNDNKKHSVVEFRVEKIEFADANPALCRENPGDVPAYESPSNAESTNEDDLPF